MSDTIPYGMLDNKYVTPDEIPDKLYGASCGCLCPQCEKPLELVNREGTKYFRHKGNEMHCHFDLDYYSLEYVWKALEESGFLDEFGLTIEDLAFFKAKFMEFDATSKTSQIDDNEKTIRKDIKSTTQVSYEDRTFKLSIRNQKYYIKLAFNTSKKELQSNEIVIDIKNIIKGKDLFSLEKKSIVDKIQEKISETIIKIMEQEVDNQKEIQQEKEIYENTKTLDELLDASMAAKGIILKYYNKRCPQCGARMCSMKMRTGASVTCENYPTCNYGAGNYKW